LYFIMTRLCAPRSVRHLSATLVLLDGASAIDHASANALRRALTRPAHAAVAVVPRIDLLPGTSEDKLLELSERLRTAGAAALLLRNPSLRQVQLVLEEQRSASGNFPSPMPVLCEPFLSTPLEAPDGAAAVVLPYSEVEGAVSLGWPLVVTRCTSAAELHAMLARPAPPEMVFASEAAVLALDGAAAGAASAAASAGREAALFIASLALGPGCAAEARELRAMGYAAVAVDFAADDWPLPPELAVRAVLSTQSRTYNSLGLKVGHGDFGSDQYWLNKKFKDARAIQKSRYAREGPPATGGGGGAAGSQVGQVGVNSQVGL
jgi:hypothetical protein